MLTLKTARIQRLRRRLEILRAAKMWVDKICGLAHQCKLSRSSITEDFAPLLTDMGNW